MTIISASHVIPNVQHAKAPNLHSATNAHPVITLKEQPVVISVQAENGKIHRTEDVQLVYLLVIRVIPQVMFVIPVRRPFI